MYRVIAVGLVVISLVGVAAPPAAASTAADQLDALLKEGKTREAYRQIAKAVQADPSLMESYGFLMAAGRVARTYSREDPPGNAGESYRVRLKAEAVECFGMAERLVEPGEEQTAASTAWRQAADELVLGASTAFNAKRFDLALDYSRAITRVSPEDRLGPALTIRIGQMVDRPELQLEGVRAAVAARFPIQDYYVLAASLEVSVENGAGLDAALAHVATGLEVVPNDLQLLAERVRLMLLADRAADATAALATFRNQTFAQLDEPADRVPYRVFLGLYSETLGQTEAARGDYEAVVKHDPGHHQARFGLGKLLVDEAAAVRRKGLDLPFDAVEESRALDEQADTLLRKARGHFEAIHDPQDPRSDVMVTLITIYGQLDDFDAVRDMQAQYDKYMYGPRK
ncbi:MAG: hypothetical protein AAF750_08195 [Planctomycetota bacterium]